MSIKPGDWWDKSWNPWEGCTPISEACENCWALVMLKRFRNQGPGKIKRYFDRIKQPANRKRPTTYFVGSLTDVFHPDINDEDRRDVFWEIQHCGWHTFAVLTKRPIIAESFLRESPFLDNILLGVTTENQLRFNERTAFLRSINAVRFISAEPLLGPIELGDAAQWLDWVIVGGETGPKARPMHPDWVRSVRDQCQAAEIPFWFKGWGTWIELHDIKPWAPPSEFKDRMRWLNLAGGHGFHGVNVVAMRTTLGVSRLLDGREWNELPKIGVTHGT